MRRVLVHSEFKGGAVNAKLITNRSRRHPANLAALALAAAAVPLIWNLPARATTDSWIGTSGGNWTDGAQWSAGTPPANGQTVDITNAFSASQTITYDYSGSPISFASLTVDATTGGTNVLSIAANTLSISGSKYVGNAGSNRQSGFGVLAQSGGTNALIG